MGGWEEGLVTDAARVGATARLSALVLPLFRQLRANDARLYDTCPVGRAGGTGGAVRRWADRCLDQQTGRVAPARDGNHAHSAWGIDCTDERKEESYTNEINRYSTVACLRRQ